MTEGIKAASNVLVEFRKILEPCFGPSCKDVLMKSDTGVIYLSSSGTFILDHLVLKHPIAKLIKDTVSKLKASTGDFSKTFIIVLSHFTSQFIGKVIEQETCRTIDGVSSRLSDSALSLFRIRNLLVDEFKKCTTMKCIGYKEFLQQKHHINSLLKTSVSGKLDLVSSKKMMALVSDVVCHPKFKVEMLDYISSRFDEVVVPLVGMPFCESHIVDGCFVSRESKPTNFNLDNVRFVLLSSADDLHQPSQKHQLIMKNRMEFFGKSPELNSIQSQLIQLLREHKVGVIFTEDILPNQMSGILLQLGIVVVSFVSEDDIKKLSKLYNTPIFSGLHDLHDLTADRVGNALFIKSTVLGNSKGCIVGPCQASPNCITPDVLNIQILLCANSQGLQIQYQDILCNLFRVLSKTYDTSTEQFFVVHGGGTFESYLSGILRNHGKECINDTERLMCSMLTCSLEAVSHLLHRNEGCKHKQLSALIGENLASVGCSAIDQENCFESFHAKCSLYITLIESAIQLIKIQYIIPVSVVESAELQTRPESDDDEE